MRSYATGDEAAIRELFARYAPTLLRMFQRRVEYVLDAQDLVQQTFLHLHRARLDFAQGLRLRPWLVTIALNLARDLLRRRGRRPETGLDSDLVVDPREPARPERDARVRAQVRRAVRRLPERQREVIELHWFDELAFSEIAPILGCSTGAARVRAHRAYVTLREELAAAADPRAA